MRMELPRFTGGLPVISLELSGRLYLSPELGMQLVHPEFLDETWTAAKEEYDQHVTHLERLENQVNKKKKAVDLAARMRDRASVRVAVGPLMVLLLIRSCCFLVSAHIPTTRALLILVVGMCVHFRYWWPPKHEKEKQTLN